MPELPEVEVTRRVLEPRVVGRRIGEVQCGPPSYFFLTPPAELERQLPGLRIEALERLGKYLLAPLSDGKRLLLHLGMSGQLFTADSRSPRLLNHTAALDVEQRDHLDWYVPDRHTHLLLKFDATSRTPPLVFRDVRKFGKVRLLDIGESEPRLDKLGPDALTITAAELGAALGARRAPVKMVLLDQSVLAGVGNIYADEALHRAGVHPERPAAKLRPRESEGLVVALREVLLRSIETGGSSINDFIRPDGSDGGFQHERRVYAREGEHCLSCRGPRVGRIERIVIGQRSSHFCPRCQR